MLFKLSQPVTKLVERYLPDPYVIVLLLTLVVLSLSITLTPFSFEQAVTSWGQGFWALLTFAMQMLMVLVAGFMLASTPVCKSLLDKLAQKANSGSTAIVMVTLVSMLASWINWGFGLVVGALFAKALARHVQVDYRVLVASAYSGFIVWHGGLSGSVSLTIATEGHFSSDSIGIITTQDTLFAHFNLILMAVLLIILPLLNTLLLPPKDQQIIVEKEKLEEKKAAVVSINTPAEK